jgi:hypothetical protein
LISIDDVSTYAINFWNLNFDQIQKFTFAFDIVSKRVKPVREKNKDKKLSEKWWIYERLRPDLYKAIESNKYTFTLSLSSKYLNYTQINQKIIFSNSTGVVSINNIHLIGVLQSIFHNEWAWRNSSTLGSSTLSYTITDSFETFPFPNNSEEINIELVLSFREQLLKKLKLGLTDLYNQFHNNDLNQKVTQINAKSFEKEYGKETWNLYNHLEIKNEGNISYAEAVPLIIKLRELHKEMDEAVLAAYGWHQDDAKWGKAIQLRHDFYEVDYLPENDRVRYTIHPEARKEVLKRLLQLNHERYAEEVAAGLHDKKKASKKSDEKKKNKEVVDDGRTQKVLFQEVDLFSQEPEQEFEESAEDDGFSRYTSKVYEKTTKTAFAPKVIQIGSVVLLKATDGRELKIACGCKADGAQTMNAESAFVKAMLGKEAGDEVKFGNGFEVVKIENN